MHEVVMPLIYYPLSTPALAAMLICGLAPGLSAASGVPVALASPEAETPRIVEGSKVTLHYHVTVPGENEVGYDADGHFIQGRHDIPSALEREVAGMKMGEEKDVALTPEEGFGLRDERKKVEIPRSHLPAEAKAGDVVQSKAGTFAIVVAVSDATAVLDYNHPLAGKPVLVHLRIVKVE
jgi:FKBP-type peptidyl-prolyl cis-trans isomerase 2